MLCGLCALQRPRALRELEMLSALQLVLLLSSRCLLMVRNFLILMNLNLSDFSFYVLLNPSGIMFCISGKEEIHAGF